MIKWLIETINIACLCFTITGSVLVNRKGEDVRSWVIYVIAAIFGVAYFIITTNVYQLCIWIFFLINDLDATHENQEEKGRTYGGRN